MAAYIVSDGDAFWTYSGGLADVIGASSGNDLYHPIQAMLIGGGGAILAYKMHYWVENKFKIDDAVGAVAVLGYAGFYGVVMAGFMLWGYPSSPFEGYAAITPWGNFIGQGCKVGLGGHLMGQKVTDQVAEMRSLPAGIDQRSPARHPDWMGPDDLALKIQEVREATDGQIPIQLKLGAARVYDDVRMAAKTGPDSIYIDGMEGGTGAGPHLATEETGVPGIAAIRQARQALDDVGMSGEITLIYAGGIRNGADVAKAIALGADAVAIGHLALIALNCNKDIPEADFQTEMGVDPGYCYHCHTGRCPVGIATQDPVLRQRLDNHLASSPNRRYRLVSD